MGKLGSSLLSEEIDVTLRLCMVTLSVPSFPFFPSLHNGTPPISKNLLKEGKRMTRERDSNKNPFKTIRINTILS